MPVQLIVMVLSMNQYFPMISGLPDYYNDAFSRTKWTELAFSLRKSRMFNQNTIGSKREG